MSVTTSAGDGNSRSKTFFADLLASVVVFLVALPLCMGVAIASGAPVAAGLITGIIGGIVVGALAGCPLQVCGPAAGLTVIVFEIIERVGFEALGLIVLVAGLLQIAAGVARLGQWFRAVSPAVIKGMLAGIGFLIVGSQFHVMIDDKPPGNGATNLELIPQAIQKACRPLVPADRERWSTELAALNESRGLLAEQGSILKGLAEPEVAWTDLAQRQAALHQRAVLWNEAAAFSMDVADKTSKALLDVQRSLAAQDVAAATTHAAAAVAALATAQRQLKHPNLAGALGLLTIVVIVLWQELAPRQMKGIPPALAAVIVVTLLAWGLELPVFHVDVPSQLWNDIHWPTLATFQAIPFAVLMQYGLLVAVVASAETLLCAAAVDQMQTGPRTRYDQELMAQGVGNTLCGLVGALPMTGVIVRSSANVLAGGKTRLSTMLHGVWLLVCVAGLAALLRMIPTSCLAAILVYTGFKLIDAKAMRELLDYGWGELVIYGVTIAVIIFEDLLSGVVVGIALSAVKVLYVFSHMEVELQIDASKKTATLYLRGAATFIRLPQLASQLERIPVGCDIHVDLTDLDFIDHACLDLLMNWGTGHEATGGSMTLDWETLHGRFRRDLPPRANDSTNGT